jgi:hypothetical protein
MKSRPEAFVERVEPTVPDGFAEVGREGTDKTPGSAKLRLGPATLTFEADKADNPVVLDIWGVRMASEITVEMFCCVKICLLN